MIIGNRNYDRGKVVGVDSCNDGDLFLPWYFQKGGGDGSGDVDASTIVIGAELLNLNPRDVYPTSCVVDVRNSRGYSPSDLMRSIKVNGQLENAVCVQHHTCGHPVKTRLLEDPELRETHVVEGHHRWQCCYKQRILLRSHLYHLYTMEREPKLASHYRNVYDDSMWTDAAKGADRMPWFALDSLKDGAKAHKTRILQKCLSVLWDKFGKFGFCVDVGCAEGAYTAVLSEFCETAYGVDHELGRIVRAQIGRLYHGTQDKVSFGLCKWKDLVNPGDVSLLLSVLHHTEDPVAFLKKCGGSRGAVVQVRVRHELTPINKGTMFSIHRIGDYEKMFGQAGYKFKHVETQKDEAFYVLWRED